MALVNKLDSNVTGLRIQEELSLGVADVTKPWLEAEPNSYNDFGQQITNVARAPIVADRQMKKGVATDLDASGGYASDLTQENLPDLAQGFFQADLLVKEELAVAIVDTTIDDFQPASGGDAYVASDLLFAQGFDDGPNNGLHVVSGVPAASSIPVTTNLTTAAAQTGIIRRVGFEFAADDLDVVITGDFATLVTGTKDFRELGLLPGEFIFLGGDTGGAAGDQFTKAANNGFKRIRSIAENAMVLDKSDLDMEAEDTGTGETVRMFFAPRMIKNEGDPSLIVRRSYQLERQLGYPDDTFQGAGNDQQVEYLVGAVPSILQFNIATADKLTMDLSFMGTDMEQRPSAVQSVPLVGLKDGPRPDLVESDAFNSSSDVSRINMSIVSGSDEAPDALFPFIQELSLTVDNNISPNKAVGIFGAFDLTTGKFNVSGTLTAYMADIATQTAVRNNDDVTLDFHFVKANQGISVDLPLVTIGDGRPNVEQDAPITLPISFEAATGAKVDSTFDHTMMMLWWDFLPNAAEV